MGRLNLPLHLYWSDVFHKNLKKIPTGFLKLSPGMGRINWPVHLYWSADFTSQSL